MVRASTLPLRLLCLSYGASRVYSEELIDRSVISSERVENKELGTVDFVKRRQMGKKEEKRIKEGKGGNKSSTVVLFRTHRPSETGRLIFQLGTSSPTLAVLAAKKVQNDVDGIDVNMGCPKKFSIQGGMGASLLEDQDNAVEIIKALKREIKGIPISAKIRLVGEVSSSTSEDFVFASTSSFMKRLESAGVDAIAVHGRTTKDSSHEAKAKERWGRMKELVECVKVPVILNGDVYTYSDAMSLHTLTSTPSIMIARGALHNPSIFSPTGPQPLLNCIKSYLRLCVSWGNHFINTKYVICEFLSGRRNPQSLGLKVEGVGEGVNTKMVCGVKDTEGLCKLFGVDVGGGKGDEDKGGLEKVYCDEYFGVGAKRKVEEEERGEGKEEKEEERWVKKKIRSKV